MIAWSPRGRCLSADRHTCWWNGFENEGLLDSHQSSYTGRRKTIARFLLDSFKGQGINSIHFCLGHLSEEIISYLSKTNVGCKWSYTVEEADDLAGTFGGIRLGSKKLEDKFLVQYGDTVLDVDYKDVMKAHEASSKAMTITYTESGEDKGNIYEEKTRAGVRLIYDKESNRDLCKYIDYGLLCINREVLDRRWDFSEKNIQLDKVQKHLSRNNEVNFIKVNGRYKEIGNPVAYSKFLEGAKA